MEGCPADKDCRLPNSFDEFVKSHEEKDKKIDDMLLMVKETHLAIHGEPEIGFLGLLGTKESMEKLIKSLNEKLPTLNLIITEHDKMKDKVSETASEVKTIKRTTGVIVVLIGIFTTLYRVFWR